MLTRVLTFRFDPVLEAIDDVPIEEFLRVKNVSVVLDHSFVGDCMPYKAVLITDA